MRHIQRQRRDTSKNASRRQSTGTLLSNTKRRRRRTRGFSTFWVRLQPCTNDALAAQRRQIVAMAEGACCATPISRWCVSDPLARFARAPPHKGEITYSPPREGEAAEGGRGSLTHHLEIGVEQHAPSAVATICH